MKKKCISLFVLLSLLVLQLLSPIGGKGVAVLAADGEDEVSAADEEEFPLSPEFTFTCLDGTSISARSDSGQATVIVFGPTYCPLTGKTLESISNSTWVGRSDIRVIFAETGRASRKKVQSYADTYTCADISVCYDDQSWKLQNAMSDYKPDNAYTPVTVLLDGENRVRECLVGMKYEFWIMQYMEEFIAPDPEMDEAEKPVTVNLPGRQMYEYGAEVLKLVNEERVRCGVSELQLDGDLTTIANQRAAEIALYYSHTRPTDRHFYTASKRGEYKLENIAMGQFSPEEVMEGWNNSQGHHANIINSRVKSIGVGCFKDSRGILYWVQYFDDEDAVGPVANVSKDVSLSIFIKKKYLHLQTEPRRTFQETDKGTSYEMDIWQSNENNTVSGLPRLDKSVFSFSSSDSTVASVNKSGNITLKGPGTAVITASLKKDASVQVKQTVIVQKSDPDPSSTPEQTDSPASSDVPEQTDSPVPSSAPEQTGSPAPSDVPEQTGSPAPSNAPEQTGSPASSDVPEQTGNPVPSDVPEQTGQPIPSDVPGQTGKPIPSSAPGPSTTPIQKPMQRKIPAKNSIIRDTSGNTYQVTQSSEVNGTVAYVKAKNNQATTANVPSKVTIDNITYEVTSISANAFRGNTKLKKVIIGKNVSSIGNSAFEGCTSLKSIVIPSKVRSIGKNAFKNCKKLKSIQIKGNVLKKVGKNAFKGIHAKAKIKVPKKQLKAYKKRLKGKGQKKTVKITK